MGDAYGLAHRLFAQEQAQAFVIGQVPYDLEQLRWRLLPPGQIKLLLGPIADHTFAAVEFAHLDIIGQATSRPVSPLLEGQLWDCIPLSAYVFYCYANERGTGEVGTPNELVAAATFYPDEPQAVLTSFGESNPIGFLTEPEDVAHPGDRPGQRPRQDDHRRLLARRRRAVLQARCMTTSHTDRRDQR